MKENENWGFKEFWEFLTDEIEVAFIKVASWGIIFYFVILVIDKIRRYI